MAANLKIIAYAERSTPVSAEIADLKTLDAELDLDF